MQFGAFFEIFFSFPLKVSENYADKANFERFHQPSSATSTDLANPRNTNLSPTHADYRCPLPRRAPNNPRQYRNLTTHSSSMFTSSSTKEPCSSYSRSYENLLILGA